jgi:mitogen-activated protein kinase kinase 1
MSPERIKNEPYSYMSDIWSLGLVLQECATSKYPFYEQSTCIEMAQTILEAKVPELPEGKFSIEFRDFLSQCLRRDPQTRLSAEELLSSPWLQRYDAVSADSARKNVWEWINALQNGQHHQYSNYREAK